MLPFLLRSAESWSSGIPTTISSWPLSIADDAASTASDEESLVRDTHCNSQLGLMARPRWRRAKDCTYAERREWCLNSGADRTRHCAVENSCPTPTIRLSVAVVNKYEGARQKEEQNLVLGEVEVEAGTWELGLDDVFPEPVHRGAVGDVRRVGRTSATGEEGSELAFGTSNKGPRVPASGEWTGVVAVGVNCGFDGIEGADDAVAALMRLESSKTTDRGERGVTAFNHESHGVALHVLVVGLTYLSGGENASELEKTILGVVEPGLRVVPGVH